MLKQKVQAHIYIVTVSAILFLISVYLMMSAQSGYDQSYLNVCISVATFSLLHQSYASFFLRKEKNWIQIDVLFLFMYYAIHFWVWFSAAVDSTIIGGFPKPGYENYVNISIAVSLLGQTAFILGYNIYADKYAHKGGELPDRKQWVKVGNLVFYAGVALTVAYALFFGKEAFEGSYVGSSIGNLGVRAAYLLQQLFVKLGIVIILLAHADKKKFIPDCKIQLGVFVGVLLMYLVLGDRSEFVYTAAVGVFAYSISYRRIALPVLLAGLLAFAFLSSAVRIARTADERSLTALYEAAISDREDVSVSAGVDNISGSGFTLLAATTAIPDKFDYYMGRLKYKELLGVIPFGRFFFYTRDKSLPYDNSSTFLTWYILGPNSSWGVGSTITADVYVDFGPPGVAIAMFILGGIASFFKKKASRSSSFIVVVVFCYFAGLLTLLPRYSYLVIIRGLIWPLVLLWILKRVFIKTRKRRSVSL